MTVTGLAERRPALALSLLCLLAPMLAACARESPELRAAIERVRAHLVDLDPLSAARVAAAERDTHPGSRELQAWHLLARARTDEEVEAEAAARTMIDEDEGDPWGWFALAGALMEQRDRQAEASEAGAEALARATGHPDIVWLQAQALIAAGDNEGALELLGAYEEASGPRAAALVHQESRALYYRAYAGRGVDNDRLEESLQAAVRARELDPDSAAGWFGEGATWSARRKFEEALPPLLRAAELSPGSTMIQQRVAQTLAGLDDLDTGERDARVAEQVAVLLATHPDEPAALSTAARMWRGVDNGERAGELDAEILARFPDSVAAEWLAVGEYREVGGRVGGALGADREPDPEDRALYERLLRQFLDRPVHRQATLKGDAFRQLFLLVGGEAEDPEDLLWMVRGMAEFEGINPHIAYGQGAVVLAERTDYHDEALEIARRGVEAGRAKLEADRSRYETDGDYERAQQFIDGRMLDALGWVHFQAGQIEEAEAELLRAYDANPKNRDNLHHLGQLYESRGDLQEAERFYVQGLAAQAPGANPNREALEALYATRAGSRDGFDDYLAEITTREADGRHTEILAERLAEPEPLPAFSLTTLDGATVSSAELAGKVVVINFWGIWCGWCVIEMPELQALHERFADDPEVLVLTLNNDRDPAEVPPWMDKNGYTLPVLLDDGYVVDPAGVTIFPTTWFLDREGRIAFRKEGWSQELLQEFTWRIEALRTTSRP